MVVTTITTTITPRVINVTYFIYLGINEWPWPIKLNANELERILNGFSDGGSPCSWLAQSMAMGQ